MNAAAERARPPAHLSVHDVAPETLDAVGRMLDVLRDVGVERAMLLVIPGRSWGEAERNRLRGWVEAGHLLAGHGWTHRVDRRRSLYHKLHGLLISRNVAEHLALDAAGIADLLRRNHAWFVEHGFEPPSHYVPPAWAMGAVPWRTLRESPFRTYETLTGVYDAAEDRFVRLPLMGFEADTPFRARCLRAFNRWNARRTGPGRPLRISLHPHDLDYRLSDDALRACASYDTRPDLPEFRTTPDA